jgi:YggT family protein
MFIAVIYYICLTFLIFIWARVILSYISILPGSRLYGVNRVVDRVTDPILLPVRRVLPAARIGGAALDLSPLVVTVVLIIIMNLL